MIGKALLALFIFWCGSDLIRHKNVSATVRSHHSAGNDRAGLPKVENISVIDYTGKAENVFPRTYLLPIDSKLASDRLLEGGLRSDGGNGRPWPMHIPSVSPSRYRFGCSGYADVETKFDFLGGGGATVYNFSRDTNVSVPFSIIGDPEYFNVHDFEVKVCPDLRFADASSFSYRFTRGLGGFACLFEGSPNKVNTEASESRSGGTGEGHKPSPEGHSLLRIKIAFGSAMVVGGYYLYGYAFKVGRRVSIEAGLPYAILGIFGVLCGVLLAAHAYFSL